jgi:hypothetical protein
VAAQAVMARYGAVATSAAVAAAVDQVVLLVTSADLLTTPLALHFCLTLLPQQPQIADQISSKFLPAALEIVKSPLLQVCGSLAPDQACAFFMQRHKVFALLLKNAAARGAIPQVTPSTVVILLCRELHWESCWPSSQPS